MVRGGISHLGASPPSHDLNPFPISVLSFVPNCSCSLTQFVLYGFTGFLEELQNGDICLQVFTPTDIGIIIGGGRWDGMWCLLFEPVLTEMHTLDRLGMSVLIIGPFPTIAQHIFVLTGGPRTRIYFFMETYFHSHRKWVPKLQWFLGLLLFCSSSLSTQQFCRLQWLNFSPNGSILTPMAQF